MDIKLYAAPMQGHTDAAYRHFHSAIYGEADAYFTPFLRVERGDVRQRDLRSLESELNENHFVIPQIIFNSEEEFDLLVEAIIKTGHRDIDLNMGCPYPMQTNHGRGAALISNIDLMEKIFNKINGIEDVRFSVKMRAGLRDVSEWREMIKLINEASLMHVTFHPRVASQKYSGELYMDEFADFLRECRHPVIYNGDLLLPSQIIDFVRRFPTVAGVMSGRGLLGRPSLFAEVKEGMEWQKNRRLDTMLEFHDSLKNHYSQRLCGDAQMLAKMQSFWEYALEEIGRKPWKGIKKATTMQKYDSAVNTI